MPLDYEKLMRWPINEVRQRYDERDTMLYAIGVGAAMDNPVAPEDLQFVYEKELNALPSMLAVLAAPPFWMADPATGIDPNMMLHGEQCLTVHRPLPAAGTLIGQDRVEEIIDKGAGKAALMYVSRSLRDASSGEQVATVGYAVVLRGHGGFGGPDSSSRQPHPMPVNAPPDHVVELATRPEQAVIYRLSGDDNPLHIDPRIAARAGFEKPILHGLASYGVAARALIRALCGNAPARLRRLDVRFASPVYPGETLRTEIWRGDGHDASFRVSVVERDIVVLNNGYVEFDPDKPSEN